VDLTFNLLLLVWTTGDEAFLSHPVSINELIACFVHNKGITAMGCKRSHKKGYTHPHTHPLKMQKHHISCHEIYNTISLFMMFEQT